MHIIEQKRRWRLEEAKAEARRQAWKEARKKMNRIFVMNLLTQTSCSVAKIAGLVGMSESYVKRVRASLNK